MKVLIADDDPVSRRLLRAHLERWGHEVTEAEDGAEAWRLFQAEAFPLVVSDWVMPGMDGPDLVRHVRGFQRPGYVYVILLTARTQKADVVEGMEAGANDFVTKPFDREELRVRVRAGERIIELERALAEQNRALREAEAALVQSEKLASLGRLAAGLAHEINNPLAYVINNLAVLRRDMQAALTALDAYREGRPADAERIEEQADLAWFRQHFEATCDKTLGGLRRVGDIVRNLRDFARLDAAELEEADLNGAVRSTLEVTASQLSKKGLQVRTELEPLPAVLCHPGKINQVLLNLVVNAADACTPGGTVVVRTRPDGDHTVVIEVQDEGCGIKPEHRLRLFEPFFTTKPVGQGTGLGLAVSFGIIRDHGGTIEVESEVGRGSIFRVRLPLRRNVG